MIDITLVLVGITILFAVFIALRTVFSLNICALCGAVFLVWLTLLVLFYLDYAIDPVLVALLMGGSIVGSMYLLEQKLKEEYQLFKLPYYLTLVFIVYTMLVNKIYVGAVVVFGLVWLVTFLIHVSGSTGKLKAVGRRIIECCKNW
ncbi:MAG: hypothetical protein WDZ88_03975 [Candidatus Paceibacterota bacterium]